MIIDNKQIVKLLFLLIVLFASSCSDPTAPAISIKVSEERWKYSINLRADGDSTIYTGTLEIITYYNWISTNNIIVPLLPDFNGHAIATITSALTSYKPYIFESYNNNDPDQGYVSSLGIGYLYYSASSSSTTCGGYVFLSGDKNEYRFSGVKK